MPQRFPTVLSVAIAAERLLTTTEALKAELEAGRLKGFKIGEEWRTTEEDLLAFIGRPLAPEAVEGSRTEQPAGDYPPLAEVAWEETRPFSFIWRASECRASIQTT